MKVVISRASSHSKVCDYVGMSIVRLVLYAAKICESSEGNGGFPVETKVVTVGSNAEGKLKPQLSIVSLVRHSWQDTDRRK